MAKEVAQESVTLETLIGHYDMSLSDIARKVDADERFVHEATRYLLETPEDISHESEKKEFLADQLNKYMKSGLEVSEIMGTVKGKTLQETLAGGKTLRDIAEDLGMTDEDAVDAFIAEATRELLMKPKGEEKTAEKYAFDTFAKYTLAGLDLNVASEMADMRKAELVEAGGMVRDMRRRDMKAIANGVKKGLSFAEICEQAGWPTDASLEDIAALEGFPVKQFKHDATLAILKGGIENDANAQKFSAARFRKYVDAGLDLADVCDVLGARTTQEKMDLIQPRIKQIVTASPMTLNDLAKQVAIPLTDRDNFTSRMSYSLLEMPFSKASEYHGDEQAALLDNLQKYAFTGLNADIAARRTGLPASEVKKQFLRPAKLHKKTLVDYMHTALTEASYGNIGVKASRFFANRSAEFMTKAKQAGNEERAKRQSVYSKAGGVMKKLSLAGKAFGKLEKQLGRPKAFLDKKIEAQIMKVGDRNETAGRVLSTAKSVLDNSVQALAVGVAATAIAPTLSVGASAALTAAWGYTYLKSARKGLYDFYGKAADSYRKDATKTPAQNRAGVRRAVGKYVKSHKSDLRKAWIKAGMNVAYGTIGAAALIKIGPNVTLNTAVGYKTAKDAIKYTRRSINGAYMVKNDLKNVKGIRGRNRRLKYTAERVATSVALAALGENAGKMGFSNIKLQGGFKSGDFFYIPVMDSTYITSKHDFFRKSMKELRSSDGKMSTGLTLDQIGRAHGYDNQQMTQFTREMTNEMLSKGKTPEKQEALFKKHAMDGIDLYEAFKVMKLDGTKPQDKKKRRELVADNIVALASAGISLNEMTEAIGLKGKQRRDFNADMTGKLLLSESDRTDKKQAFFDAVHQYGGIGLDKDVVSRRSESLGISASATLDACREAKAFYRKQRKQEIEQGRTLIEQGKKREKQAKNQTLSEAKDFMKTNSSVDFFARLRQKKSGGRGA